jgi:DNA processing protein
MTHDHAVALTLLPTLPRVGLTDRLRQHDPSLIELAEPLLERARELRWGAERHGIRTIGWNQPDYPQHLLTIADAPPALWYRGHLACVSRPGVALVGARAASSVGLEAARRLAAGVAARGLTVISGLARGVDSEAHAGALSTGRTAAVLGGGVDDVYPPEHAGLASLIAREGVVLSEFPPGMPALPFHFPLRNRIISGLARIVVVVEAAEKSGSLITAACALEQGREVMAVPGNVLYGRNRGGHALIRDGAKIVETADDIVSEVMGSPVLAPGGLTNTTFAGTSTSGQKVVALMEPGEPCEVDELATRSGLDGPGLLRALTDLELAGLVRRVGAGCYSRVS